MTNQGQQLQKNGRYFQPFPFRIRCIGLDRIRCASLWPARPAILSLGSARGMVGSIEHPARLQILRGVSLAVNVWNPAEQGCRPAVFLDLAFPPGRFTVVLPDCGLLPDKQTLMRSAWPRKQHLLRGGYPLKIKGVTTKVTPFGLFYCLTGAVRTGRAYYILPHGRFCEIFRNPRPDRNSST